MPNRASRLLCAGTVCTMLAVVLTGCGHKAPVNVQSAGTTTAGTGPVIVAAGTRYYGRLAQPIGTKVSKDGDTFTLAQTDTLLHKDPALHGAVVSGHIEDVHAAGPLHKPSMTIVFDTIQLADGTSHPIDVQLVSMNQFQPKTHHLRTIGLMIGGAVAGHMAAKRMGKKHGGLAGAAAGYAVSQELKTDIYVPAGTVVQIQFQSPVTGNSAQ